METKTTQLVNNGNSSVANEFAVSTMKAEGGKNLSVNTRCEASYNRLKLTREDSHQADSSVVMLQIRLRFFA